MFFETRINPPPVSLAYMTCNDMFLAGRVKDARKAALALKGIVQPTVNDLLLCADISRACGRHTEYAALGVILHRRFPRDSRAQIEYANSLINHRTVMSAIKELTLLAETCETLYVPIIQAMLASAYAQIGFRTTAEKHRARAETADNGRDPLTSYHLAWMAMYKTNWQVAIEHGLHAVRRAPQWPQARVTLISAYLATGNASEAKTLLDDSLLQEIEDEALDLNSAFFALSQKQIDVACIHFERYRTRWDGADAFHYTMIAEAIARWSHGQPEAARIAAIASGSQLLEIINNAQPNGQHCFIPTGYIAQKLNQCVPTSVAMIVEAQGATFDAESLSRQMQGTNGTQLWRMRQVLQDKGYTVLCLKTEPPILRHMLDCGIPLMGCIETQFTRHVEVLCGYNSGLDIYFLRDPMVWYPNFLTGESLTDRYAEIGNAVIAILRPENATQISIQPEWIADTATRLINLEQACCQGEREIAEKLASEIPDGTPATILRDQLSYLITISPSTYRTRMKGHAANPSIPPMLRWKILRQMGDFEAAAEMRRMIGDHSPHPFYRDLAAAFSAVHTGETRRHIIDHLIRMVERYPELEFLWTWLSDEQSQIGDLSGAQKSIANALEISPASSRLHERNARLSMEDLTYTNRRNHVETLCRLYPDAAELKVLLAQVKSEDPDGLQYEAAWKDYLRFFPQDPFAYASLADWYLEQNREDIAIDILEQGRRLLGAQELPYADFENSGEVSEISAGTGNELSSSNPEILLRSAARELNRSRHIDNPENWPSFRQLQKINRDTPLPWHQSVRLLALRICGICLYQKTDTRKHITSILPAALPGPQDVAEALFLESINLNILNQSAAKAVHSWINTRTGSSSSHPPRIRFLIAVLREKTGDFQRSLLDHQQLCREFHNYSRSLYHIARIFAGQGRLSDAIRYYQQCLDTEPGYAPALTALKNIYYIQAKPSDAARYHALLMQKYPYSFDLFFESVQRMENDSGIDRALWEAERIGEFMPPAYIAAAKSHLLIDANRIAEAARVMSPFTSLIGKHWTVHFVFLRLALYNSRSIETENLIKTGLRRWPHLPLLAQVHAEQLATKNTYDAVQFIDKQFATGSGTPELALLRLRNSSLTAKQAIQCILNVSETYRPIALDCYAEALNWRELYHENIAFLKWGISTAPQHLHLRYRLALQHLAALNNCEAQSIATALLNEDPENPDHLHLMGKCLIDTDPKKAESFLIRAIQKDRSSEYLTTLALAYQVANNLQRAIELYREVLTLNPRSAFAIVSLYLLKEHPQKLKDLVFSTLNSPMQSYDVQYFHVTAVIIATVTSSKLPEAWFSGATRRWTHLDSESPCLDEKDRLSDALFAWHIARNEFHIAKQYSTKNPYLVQSTWPGTKWVPAKPSS